MTQRQGLAVRSVATLFPENSESLTTHILPSAPEGRSGQLRRMDRLCGLALCAADRALLGDGTRVFDGDTAMIVGSAYGCHRSDEEYFRSFLAGEPGPRLFAYTLPSSPVGEVSIHHGLRGPGLSIVNGRTAGLEAIVQADELLRDGHARTCLVIACEVAAPIVTESAEDAALCDGASAILLAASTGELADAGQLGQIVAATSTFVPDDPSAAIAACVAQLNASASSLICDPQTRVFCPARLGPVHVHATPSCGAASSVAVLAALPSLSDAGDASYIVLSADSCGLAAAVKWQRRRSSI